MFSTNTRLQFRFAPATVVIDLKTMKILASGQVSVQQAISACNALPND